MPSIHRTISLVLCLSIPLSACHRHHKVATEELRKLDGFRAGEARVLVDLANREIEFDDGTTLTLVFQPRPRTLEVTGEVAPWALPLFQGTYRFIDVEGNTFRGITGEGMEIRVSLSEVDHAVVSVLSGWRVFAYIAGPTVGVAVALGVTILLVYLLALLFFGP